MQEDRLKQIIERADAEGEPRIELIKRASATGRSLGIFASSFNPPTAAHVELTRRAAQTFSLDETLALASLANADKTSYSCSLEDRLIMLELAFASAAHVSIGLSSRAFFVDMVDALRRIYPESDLLFVVGFDTFERVFDIEDRYTDKYYRRFSGRDEALDYLFSRSRIAVAARRGARREEVRGLLQREPARFAERVLYLDFPADLGERSATEVRERVRDGESIAGLVPESVEQYIKERELYR
jgi:nicotinate (nicotinamide) nucleotide adenylyltransferase